MSHSLSAPVIPLIPSLEVAERKQSIIMPMFFLMGAAVFAAVIFTGHDARSIGVQQIPVARPSTIATANMPAMTARLNVPNLALARPGIGIHSVTPLTSHPSSISSLEPPSQFHQVTTLPALAVAAILMALGGIMSIVRRHSDHLVSMASNGHASDVAMMAVVGIAADRSIKVLLEKHCFAIDELARRTADIRDPAKHDNIWLMRFAVARNDDIDAAEEDIRQTIAWRTGEGKFIVEAATRAIAEATVNGADNWHNEPIMAAAPYSSIISKYITPSQVLTISTQDTQGTPDTNDNDLVYVIRAAAINDKDLMKEVTVEQCVQFFLYAKEITFQVADKRTRQSGRLVTVITANDLQGINLFGDATFRKVLSQASKRAVTLYPLLAGPTLLLNLPRVLGALIKVFKPLFPKSVQEKLKFEQGPLKDVKDLRQLLQPEVREKFLSEIQIMLL